MNRTITFLIFITATLMGRNTFCMLLSLTRFSPAWQSQQGNRLYINQILSPDKYNKLHKEIKKHKRLLELLEQDSTSDVRKKWTLEDKIKKNNSILRNINKKLDEINNE